MSFILFCGHRSFSAEKVCDPASRRRAPAGKSFVLWSGIIFLSSQKNFHDPGSVIFSAEKIIPAPGTKLPSDESSRYSLP
ncbi:hypothetical protein A3A09_00815 [Candidatus Nomurabacteria bacterium RIFCSPLOWO2_01_FULL_42_20]|uniref:Uncharacterized protein n=1 Tax=Candidatus Nomurabacteria bacterium RIFCSPHIGHO2_01_FULL_42_16 TaxID=1801743 RepID=A0A1F6VHF3_9BACT|nr:MAG: hypothetical protein A2824_00670 [Candidatus Nomurabacteria bacterium RIFCSPHIGHO2_01_FULL_42_16]OGI92303.1 MAG: hypothetical protein A3A09_00815 [Candidatus Nomurabacteria bacterium RIFCSPLOWO2_01_FULL_42_20]